MALPYNMQVQALQREAKEKGKLLWMQTKEIKGRGGEGGGCYGEKPR